MDRCKLKNQDDGKLRAITLFTLSSAFLILGAGIILALLVFLVEMVISPYKKGGLKKDVVIVV